ncbi:MAG: amidohydrolase family protein, partial [Armatimonadota bacterium]
MERVVLRGAQVFDGTGRAPQQGVTVVIEHDRIADVVTDGQTGSPGSARVIDLTGCTLLPGLIDMHVHLGFGGRTARETEASMALKAARN